MTRRLLKPDQFREDRHTACRFLGLFPFRFVAPNSVGHACTSEVVGLSIGSSMGILELAVTPKDVIQVLPGLQKPWASFFQL